MKIILTKVEDEAKDTKSFFWKPEKKFNFKPGQYLYYTLPKLNYDDPRGATRQFTIASSPTEDLIQMTTRITQSGFKRTLDELSIGAAIEAEGPFGIFTPLNQGGQFINHNSSLINHIFIAGGIGITPFRSIIKYTIDKKLVVPMYLIYSNSDNEFVFKKELDKWSGIAKDLKVECFDSSNLGHLNKIKINELIKNYKLEIKNCTFWISGSPSFVSTMESILEEMKIDTERIKTDKFTGY